MKFCVMSYTIARQAPNGKPDLAAMIKLTQELGLEAIEWVTTYGEDPKEVRKMMADAGLKTSCYTFFVDLNHATAEERKPGLDQAKRELDAAAALGADRIMVVTPGSESFTREQSRTNFVEAIKEIKTWADKAKIMVSVENFPGHRSPFVSSADILEGARLIPGLKLTFDSGNVATGGESPAAAFPKTAKLAVHAHFKDWDLVAEGQGMKGLDGRFYKPALIGEGILDHKATLAAMRKCGYPAYISVEYEGNKYLADVATRKAAEYLKGLVSSLG